MRLPLWLLAACGLTLVWLAAACAQSTASAGSDAGDLDGLDPDDEFDAGSDPTTGDPQSGAGATGTACSLALDGISFSSAACTNAMQSFCCNETQACFYENDDCGALHTCVLKCVQTSGASSSNDAGTSATDSGAKDAGDSGTTASDGGTALSACENACYAQYPQEALIEQAYNACYVKNAVAACQ